MTQLSNIIHRKLTHFSPNSGSASSVGIEQAVRYILVHVVILNDYNTI